MRRFFYLLVFLTLISCASNRSSEEDILAYFDASPSSVSQMDICNLNLVLGEKGELADKGFKYPQAGPGSLVPEWNFDPAIGEYLSDIYFSMGHIALSQRMAFETLVVDNNSPNISMLKRLVQTNLIYGAYPVARKYLSILSDFSSERKWVEEHIRFLDNDEEVENDPLLGSKRRCIPTENFLADTRGLDSDLKDIIRANPEHKATIQYLGMIYLLDCDFDSFSELLDEFYGTEVLPVLPLSFREAVCLMSEAHPALWRSYGISSKEYDRFRDFRSRLSNGLDQKKYSDTYWYYVMKVNEQ